MQCQSQRENKGDWRWFRRRRAWWRRLRWEMMQFLHDTGQSVFCYFRHSDYIVGRKEFPLLELPSFLSSFQHLSSRDSTWWCTFRSTFHPVIFIDKSSKMIHVILCTRAKWLYCDHFDIRRDESDITLRCIHDLPKRCIAFKLNIGQ